MPDLLETIAAAFSSVPTDAETGEPLGVRLVDLARLAADAARGQVDALAADNAAEVAAAARELQAQVEQLHLAVDVARGKAADAEAAHADAADRADQTAGQLDRHLAGRKAWHELLVQAKARWDHEGGPDVLRDAIRACEALT